ncbi:pseudouridine synthase [Glaciimonas immobilis]|uniref:tRNA pseudouridine32 synthase/23S rRNA pseudouridine746 synthase n=1 Tax=Glaciimonas immobilis TaxID=728004 RepID=A0A840RMK7_9BURK|nr:pseudouridine synthase [Glaciimonas immobilis]KAF3997831.1 pseudouridine synthase [Glaciimonas immobilis]MBB5199537.1 tRNA pseudouridine32 synthase/23S rRNA pseudouridine746 synthase [Glaciimonas immobilis]
MTYIIRPATVSDAGHASTPLSTRSLPLPVVDGVAPSYVWLPAGDWPDLLTFLIQRFPAISGITWVARMDKGEVVDANGIRLTSAAPYRHGGRIYYYRELDAETPIPFEEVILYQDERLLVVDKPHFLPVIPAGRFLHETLLVRLKKKTGLSELSPIHRLDRETAGVIIFSRDIASRGAYQSLFQHRKVDKVYEAVAPSMPQLVFPLIHQSRMVEGTPFFRMEEVSGEPNSETQIDLIEHRQENSLYRLHPLTGKKHQLRVHMAALGMPIVNDVFYPDINDCKGDDWSSPLKLLAKSIAFEDPISGQRLHFESNRTI